MSLYEQFNQIFHPRSVAVVGASKDPDKVASLCLANVMSNGYLGQLYPVNPGLEELAGLKVYPSVKAIPEEVDLVLIAVPAAIAVSVVEDCATKGVRGVILITGGFKEVGTEVGLNLQERLKTLAGTNGMRIFGPNTLGLANPGIGLNATFAAALDSLQAGPVAVAAQSGGMCGIITNALSENNLGISKAVGLGNTVDVNFTDLLTYWAQDSDTKLIVLYAEGISDAAQFMKVAQETVKQKPVLVLKGGKHERANAATLSHTGALAGKYELYNAAFAQTGLMIVNDVIDLVDMAKALVLQSPAQGNRVAIVSTMGGPSVVMTDRCLDIGLKLADFSTDTWHKLRKLVPALTAVDNPVDIAWLADDSERCFSILDTIMQDDGVDAMAGCISGTDYGEGFVKSATDISRRWTKPITVCVTAGAKVASKQRAVLEKGGVPCYPYPEQAITGLSAVIKYGEILRMKS